MRQLSIAALAAFVAALGLLLSSVAHAGVPECHGIRLEDAKNCEIRGDLQCTGGCSQLGVYKKACATKLHTVCREECTLAAEPTCTDSCTESCSADCDRGVNVICIHNCFGECSGSCDASCKDSADKPTCIASCEATCDGECDTRCAPVVDGSCYKHCIECCGGSCTAQANMNCQTSCQEQSFEDCEYEAKADCSASCSGSGALFCDGEFVLAGSDLLTCAQKLVSEGIGNIDVSGQVSGDLSKLNSKASVSACCAMPGRSQRGAFAPALALGILALTRRGRRRTYR